MTTLLRFCITQILTAARSAVASAVNMDSLSDRRMPWFSCAAATPNPTLSPCLEPSVYMNVLSWFWDLYSWNLLCMPTERVFGCSICRAVVRVFLHRLACLHRPWRALRFFFWRAPVAVLMQAFSMASTFLFCRFVRLPWYRIGDNKCAATIVECKLGSAHTCRRGSLETCLYLHLLHLILGFRGKWL